MTRGETPPRLTVALTGAGGKTGRAVLEAVTAAGHTARALVRDPRKGNMLGQHHGVEVVIGDMTSANSLVGLLAGCDVTYHIPPNMSTLELPMAHALVTACRRVGVNRLIYHSVLHPQCRAMPHHWAKLEVEDYLLRAGLNVVFLQPAPYMQNLHPYLEAALNGSPMPFPYGPHVVLSMVDLADVAHAAVTVLVGEEHIGGTYQLCASDRHTQGEAWREACEAVGIDEPFRSVTRQRWRQTTGARLPDTTAEWLVSMFDHYDDHGLVGSSLPLTKLLERPPTSLPEHLQRHAVHVRSSTAHG